MKTLSIIGIIVTAIGIIGCLSLIGAPEAEGDASVGFLGLLIYGYFLAFSILSLKRK